MTVEQLRNRLLEIGRELRMHGDYELAIKLAGYFPPIFPRSDAVKLQAETLFQWAEEFERQPVSKAEAISHRQELQKKFFMAGQFYEQLAQFEMRSVDYPNLFGKPAIVINEPMTLNQRIGCCKSTSSTKNVPSSLADIWLLVRIN